MRLPRKLKKKFKLGIRELYDCYAFAWEDIYKNYKIMQGQDETSEDYRKRVLEYMKESENEQYTR